MSGVVLSGSRESPVVEHQFDVKAGTDGVPEQINDLVRALRSRIAGLGVERCVVRIADFSRTPNNKLAPRYRLMIEGALVFACRDQGVVHIQILPGKEVGAALSCSKEDALARGEQVDSKRREAASAAMAALER